MKAKVAFASLGCLLVGCYSAPIVTGKQQQINLDTSNNRVLYFRFPQGAQLKVTELNCPVTASVNIVCRTSTNAQCGTWNLQQDGTAAAGSRAETGIANLVYDGPAEACRATIVVQSP
ncbi:MAG TPA: hypothetical protein VIH36_13685 [Casimicrobiaceae bacterium]